MTNPILLAWIFVIANTISDIISKILMQKRKSPWSICIYDSLIGGLLLTFVVPIQEIELPPINGAAVLLCASLTWATYLITDLKALHVIDIGISGILNTLGLILVTLSGIIFFAESLSTSDLLGIILILSGIFVGVRIRTGGDRKGVTLRIIALFLSTIAIVLDKVAISMSSAYLVLLSGYIVPGIACLIFSPITVSQILSEVKSDVRLYLISPIIYAAIGYGFILGIANGNLWETVAIGQARPLLIMLLATIILKERQDIGIRTVGAVISFLGALLISLR